MKKSSTYIPHHKEYAIWSQFTTPEGERGLRADFSYLERVKVDGKWVNPHYEGAKRNISSYSNYSRALKAEATSTNESEAAQKKGPTTLDMSKVKFDDEKYIIEITGRENCKRFISWIGHDCPRLNERFVESGIYPTESFAALIGNHESVFVVPSRKRTPSQPEASDETVATGLLFEMSPLNDDINGFDPPGRVRGMGKTKRGGGGRRVS